MSGRGPIVQGLLAVVCLAVAAALLAGGILGYLYAQDGLTLETEPFDLSRFRFLEGAGATEADRLRLDASDGNRVMAGTGRHVVQADEWPYLAVQVNGLERHDRATFFWRLPGQGELAGRRLGTLAPGIPCIYDLRADPRWSGPVLSEGFMAESQGRLEIRRPRLVAAGPTAAWAAMACEWVSFRPWNQRSGNFTFSNRQVQWTWLIPLLAGWVLLAFGIWAAVRRLGGRRVVTAGLLVIPLGGWLVADLRWLANGWMQLEATESRYAGLAIDQRVQAGADAALSRFIEGLKRRHLPAEPANIFITADPDQRYLKLRAQYHLLPHRVFAYHKTPQAAYAKHGGYLLMLNKPSDLQRDLITGWLLRDREVFLKTELLERSPWGDLYRLPDPSAAESTPQDPQPAPDAQQAGQ